MEVFSGAVSTSTVTGELFLPDALEAFLRRQDVRPGPEERAHLAFYLAQGWSVLGTVLYDPAPSAEGVARVGPLRLEFSQEQLDLPLLRQGPGGDVPVAVSVVAAGPRVSGELRSRPWRAPRPTRRGEGELVLTFAAPVRDLGDLGYRLADQHGFVAPDDAFLTRGFLVPGAAQLDRTTFVAPGAAQEAPTLPARSGRGDPSDVARCVALGLVPLLFAPESWLLRWFEGRSRARARTGGSTLGVKAWAGWALVVGAYWWVVLADVARVAAVVPLLVGALQLALPYTDRDPAPVRATFRRARRDGAAVAKRATNRPRREAPDAGPQPK